MEDTKIENYKLFPHMIGGHAFILKNGNGKIYKTATKTEIEFYEDFKTKNIEFSFVSKYFGYVNQYNDSKQYTILEDFWYKKFDKYFCKLILDDLLHENFNLENDPEFDKKIIEFIKEKQESFDKNENDNSYNEFKEELKLSGLDKIKWIIFGYIKWSHHLHGRDFIILEDLTYGITLPAIIDLKIGFLQKKSKKDPLTVKQYSSSIQSGFRIMGLQNYNVSKYIPTFKNRYDLKMIDKDESNKYIKEFFSVEGVLLKYLVKLVVIELNEIIKQIKRYEFLDVPTSSILIVYDADYFSKLNNLTDNNIDDSTSQSKFRIKLIDFSCFGKSNQKDFFEFHENLSNVQDKTITDSIENIINLLE